MHETKTHPLWKKIKSTIFVFFFSTEKMPTVDIIFGFHQPPLMIHKRPYNQQTLLLHPGSEKSVAFDRKAAQ